MIPLLTVLLSCGPEGPVATVDVVVVGSGGAGVGAALAAERLGAEVLLLEREETLGGASAYGGILWAADSRFMREAGEHDSVERALDEWPGFTEGGWAEHPTVQSFVRDSASVVEWLVDEVGSPFLGVSTAEAAGVPARAHHLGAGDNASIHLLLDQLDSEVWTGCEATSLVWEDGEVVGVRYLTEGEESWVRAGAVVVATGGFARNLDLVRADRPDLHGIPLVFDHAPGVDGGGHPLVQGAGAGWVNPGGLAVYVHGVPDWRPGREGELVRVHALEQSAIVGPDGVRVDNEYRTKGFVFSDHLATAGRLVALYPRGLFESGFFYAPSYDGPPSEEDELDARAVYEAGLAVASSQLAEVAEAMDLDLAGLESTVLEVEEAAATGQDPRHDKAGSMFVSFQGEYAAVELTGATSKAFSGWRTDANMRVISDAYVPVQGLYGAGEAIGFLGTDAVGRGFSGSMTAVYWSGLTAGESAAERALGLSP